MKPRKTALSLLCAVALTLTLLVVPSSASGSLFFLSLNDTLPVQRLGLRAGERLQQPDHGD